MVGPGTAPRTKRVTYKAYLTLLPSEWQELREEAHRRGLTGVELLSGIIAHYLVGNRAPLPADPPEDLEDES